MWTELCVEGYFNCVMFTLQTEEQECNKKLKSLMATANNQADRIPVTNSQEFLTSKIKETEKIIK